MSSISAHIKYGQIKAFGLHFTEDLTVVRLDVKLILLVGLPWNRCRMIHFQQKAQKALEI